MARKAIDWDYAEEIVDTLPLKPPPRVHEIMRERGLANKHVLIYKVEEVYNPLTDTKEKMCKVTCSNCGESAYMEYLQINACWKSGAPPCGYVQYQLKDTIVHGKDTLCTECGAPGKAVHANFIGSSGYEIDETCVLTAENVRGHLALMEWRIVRFCDEHGREFWKDYRRECVTLIGGHVVRAVGYKKNYYSISWGHVWEIRKGGCETIGMCEKDVCMIEQGVEIGTDSEKSAFSEYMACGLKGYYPAAYMALWAKHNNLENLTRQGFRRFINEVLDKGYHTCSNSYSSYVAFSDEESKEHVNWSKKKPHEMLGVDKQELWVAKTYSMDVFEHYKKLLNAGIRLTKDQLDAVEHIGVRKLTRTMKDMVAIREVAPTEVRALNYLIKQEKMTRGIVSDWGMIILKDYWEMCRMLYGEVPKSMRWPKDVHTSHDTMSKTISEKEDPILAEAFERREKQLEKYSFSCPELNLMIRPCRTQREMINEGKVLDHCVARYARDHAKALTSIFLVRRLDEKDKPYYTLEWQDGEIIQDHGYKNKLQTDEILAFEKEWLKHVAEVDAKKGKVNGTQDQPNRLAV